MVTIAWYSTLIEAQHARLILHNAGIRALIPEEHTAALGHPSVRVQVFSEEEERARELLAQPPVADPESL